MACHVTGAVSALHFAGMWGNAFLRNNFTDDEQMNVSIISEETTTRRIAAQEAIGSALWWIKPADSNFYSGCGGEIIRRAAVTRMQRDIHVPGLKWSPDFCPSRTSRPLERTANKVKRKNVPSFLLSRSFRMGVWSHQVCLNSAASFCERRTSSRTMCCFRPVCHYW